MNSTFRSIIRRYTRHHPQSLPIGHLLRGPGVRFRPAIPICSKPEPTPSPSANMAEKESDGGDVMYNLGHEYATRCEDEGFGVICAGKQVMKDDDGESGTVDVMYHSFGEGYATRCEDEGFGLIYAGKQSFIKDHDDHEIIENKFAFEMENHFKKDKVE